MDETDLKKERLPEIIRIERRAKVRAELSSADIMKILRQRTAKVVRGGLVCRYSKVTFY
jgi:hypothetical protein